MQIHNTNVLEFCRRMGSFSRETFSPCSLLRGRSHSRNSLGGGGSKVFFSLQYAYSCKIVKHLGFKSFLIGISDAATIAQWKDALNDAWADLGELIDTRTQMLEASKELHKYFHDCKDVLGRILEKENSMSEELGRDSGSVSALLRKHQNFLQDLQGTYRH